ncbi:PREDICTED: uncharacterized protein LOC108661152 [Theobroma cacao]|uniref:Uncharacterized protein LOC108661152 n=1 Tax=Theobroma cacao TaxID=3641 RepID=A0AB32W352_THECC|nr:PREDICTED: uncharacterized protein LOC108661152 [Theobroma cacao]
MEEEMREQLAKMMELMTSLSKGKRVTEESASLKNPSAQDTRNSRDDPPYPLGFTPPYAQTFQKVHPQVMPFDYSNVLPPLGHQPTHGQFGLNFEINPVEPIHVSNLDDPKEQEKLRKSSSQTEETKEVKKKYDLLEEHLLAVEGEDRFGTMDAVELCLVPDVVILPKFKVPEFEKYDGTKCLMAHITTYCQKMAAQSHDDKFLIHLFQDSLTGSTARWYVQLDRSHIKTWKDLARAFMAHYKHVVKLAPDRLSLQTMEKKASESFKEYAQRWRDVTTQVQPPLTDKEMTVLFINTLKAPFYERLIGNATKNFIDLVLSREIIEGAIKNGKIKGNETTSSKKGTTFKKKKGIIGNIAQNPYPYQLIPQPIFHPRAPIPPLMPQSLRKPNLHQLPIPIFKFLPLLIENQYLNLVPMKTIPNPSARNYNPNAKCDYHMGAIGHSTEKCRQLKEKIENLMKDGTLTLELMERWKSTLS